MRAPRSSASMIPAALAFRKASAAGIIEVDARWRTAHRLVHDFANFQGVGFGERAAEYGKVLREDVYEAAVDAAETGDESIAGRALLVHAEVRAAMTHELVE